MREGNYDPKERDRQKHLARARDEADLASGRTSPEELQERNRFFQGLDAAAAKIRTWKIFS